VTRQRRHVSVAEPLADGDGARGAGARPVEVALPRLPAGMEAQEKAPLGALFADLSRYFAGSALNFARQPPEQK